jgi:peptidyl-prolyl cis-trans isomerase SurA
MEQIARANPSSHAADPGEVRLDTVNPPAFRQVLASISFDRATQPVVTSDGIAVMIVCSREEKNLAQQGKQEVQAQLLNERVELLSRQLLANLRRKATIDLRANGA